jgi:peptide/nickel transport system substrate-binding protein
MNKKYLLSLLFLFLVLAACTNQTEEVEKGRDNGEVDELVLAIGSEPEDGFDPTTGWGRYGSPLFQSTLLEYDEAFNINNDLAENFQVQEDGMVWTVDLKEDVTFSDGELLTADDVVFTFQTAKESGSIIDLNNVDRIEALDDHTVQFTLKEPQSTFIYLLVSIGIVPEHAYDHQYRENPVGSGPYQLVQWDKGQQMIVEANPAYYGETPSFNKLTILFLEEDTAMAAAQAGEVDVALTTPAYADQEIDGMELVRLPSVDNIGVMFPYVPAGDETEEGHPIGNDVTADTAIRKAINLAVDREALVEGVLEGYGRPAYTVADQLPWWNPETAFEDGRLEEAKELLEEGGWTENEQGIREKDGMAAEMTLYYPAGDQTRQSLSLVFADMLEPLGIDIATDGKSWGELETLMYSNPVMMGWGSHDPLEIYNLYSGETRGIGYYNANYYANETVDSYLNEAMHATTEEEAYTNWKNAQWDGETGFSAQGDAPWAWLVNRDHLYFINENLEIGEQKIQPHGHGWPITDFIDEWHWKEQK